MEKYSNLRQIKEDLTELCVNIKNRHVGSKGNQRAAGYTAKRLKGAGFTVKEPEFECIDWEYGNVDLRIGEEEVKALISPYSPYCEVRGSFETASNIDELINKDFTGEIAVLHGELCKEQIMPKNFTFYNPDHHKELVKILEEKTPIAIVAITNKNPELAGALYPFPLFEDGDFDIPSVYLTEEEGEKILSKRDLRMYLKIESYRIPSKGNNVIAVKEGKKTKKIVFSAHIDTKKGTPGALDNGGGVSTLLSLADSLRDYRGEYTIEIVLFNGEDYYAHSGEILYLKENEGKLNEILLNINVDAAGFIGHKSTFCHFKCEKRMREVVEGFFEQSEAFVEIEPWYQGDHMIFAMNEVPAVAITSNNFGEILSEIAHTPKDTIELVDINIISDIVEEFRNLIDNLNNKL